MKVIYLAGGCFWGTEAYLKALRGVSMTTVGYANGRTENPTYEQVCAQATGFAEAVMTEYDPDALPLDMLLRYYFESVDPTSVNRQGGDVGDQYRTGIYYENGADEHIIRAALSVLSERIGKPVAIECEPLRNFYPAEEYHQDYLDKNPNGYCHIPNVMIERAFTASREG